MKVFFSYRFSILLLGLALLTGGAQFAHASTLDISPLASVTLLSRGDSGSNVFLLQQALGELGYLDASPNGVFGPQTYESLVLFQRAQGLDSDGIFGHSTYEALLGGLRPVDSDPLVSPDAVPSATSVESMFIGPVFEETVPLAVESSPESNMSCAPVDSSCALDLVSGTFACSSNSLSQVSSPGNSSVVRAHFGSDFSSLRLSLQFSSTEMPSDWILNIGDSETNNGWGGDAGTQTNNAEFQMYNGLLSAFRNNTGLFTAGLPHIVLNSSFDQSRLLGGRATFVVSDGYLDYVLFDAEGREISSGTVDDEYFFSLLGQDDAKGDENSDLYFAFNRTIGDAKRIGQGVTSAVFELLDTHGAPLLADPDCSVPTSSLQSWEYDDTASVCHVDFVSRTVDGCSWASFVEPISQGSAVLSFTLPRGKGLLGDVVYGDSLPSGWSLHIGDSDMNNGWGGSALDETSNAEAHIFNGLLSAYRSSSVSELSQTLFNTPLKRDLLANSTVSFVAFDNYLSYEHHSLSGELLAHNVFEDPYLFDISYEGDTADSTLFVGLNRTIYGSRVGEGVVEASFQFVDLSN